MNCAATVALCAYHIIPESFPASQPRLMTLKLAWSPSVQASLSLGLHINETNGDNGVRAGKCSPGGYWTLRQWPWGRETMRVETRRESQRFENVPEEIDSIMQEIPNEWWNVGPFDELPEGVAQSPWLSDFFLDPAQLGPRTECINRSEWTLNYISMCCPKI